MGENSKIMEKKQDSFLPSPLFGSLLGLCPAIVACGNFASGTAVALGLLLSMLLLGILMPLVRRVFPERLWAALAFALAASLAALYSLLVEAYSPLLFSMSGIFLPLIAVNCLILGTLRKSIRMDGNLWPWLLSSAWLYFFSLVSLAAFREAFGAGRLSLPLPAGIGNNTIILFQEAPMRLLASPAGGFILLGFLTCLYRAIQELRGRRII